jgi:hypothetical protein
MTPLFGNVAVPVLFPQPLLALAVLVPIVGIEGLELRRKFDVTYGRVLEANLLSTIIGIPIALLWIGLCNWVINDNTGGWGTTGLISRASLTDLDAMWVLSALVTGAMVPCFALSVLIEGSYLRARLGIPADRPFWYGVIRAHCYSYAVLLGANLLWFAAKIR